MTLTFGHYERGERIPASVVLSDGYEGVTHAGVAMVARDTGRVLLAQRAFDEDDEPGVQETWEFPGGGLDDGEDAQVGAFRESREEVGVDPMTECEVTGGWRSDDGVYQGFVCAIDSEIATENFQPNDEVQAVGWFSREEIEALGDTLRPEVRLTDWDLIFTPVSGNEDDMPEDTLAASVDEEQTDESEEIADYEPEWDELAVEPGPIPIHGVLAPEDVATGDQRGFNAGSISRRPLRLPFSYQKVSIGGHDGSVVVGSVDRLMRKDGLIHYDGWLMPSPETDEFVGVMEFFGGRYGVSVDGDQGSLDMEKSEADGIMWFDAVRASGLTGVAIPAFYEAFAGLGPHAEMPADDAEETLAASGLAQIDMAGGLDEFKRGPGWVTNPRETSRLHTYWTKKGEPGYRKVAWGTPGDFRRARALIGEKIAKNSPAKMKYINQIIAQWHFDALGYWPGELGKPGNAPDTKENRQRAARHAKAAVETIDREDIQPVEDDEAESAWEAVLVSSAAGAPVRPPSAYFQRQETGSALVIEDPDENGFRHTYGYAAEWGVCHIGFANKCVEPPRAFSDAYPDFHLGRTKTDEGYINTGVLTYNVGHRDADTILSESPTQAHFDNLRNAWAAVRVGEDDRGIWFSGVVLPKVDADDVTLIEASGQVSGEWKAGALRACLAVNVPGFPVVRASAVYDENGNVAAMAASAFNDALTASVNGVEASECGPTPAERIAALRQIDAEVRFETAKAAWS